MYPEPARLLWAPREARALGALPPLPPLEIVGGFFGPGRRTDPATTTSPTSPTSSRPGGRRLRGAISARSPRWPPSRRGATPGTAAGTTSRRCWPPRGGGRLRRRRRAHRLGARADLRARARPAGAAGAGAGGDRRARHLALPAWLTTAATSTRRWRGSAARAADWIDLSTGINRLPYPLPPLPDRALRALPTARTPPPAPRPRGRPSGAPGAACLPLAGAQAAIRLLPRLRPPGRAGVLGPTYNEHAAAFAAAGWTVEEVADPAALRGFDAAVVVNPNNPDGRRWRRRRSSRSPRPTACWSSTRASPTSIRRCRSARRSARPGLIVLRSFGKFFGLAGLRLGFALGAEAEIARLRDAAGPWAVSGPALAAGRVALADAGWAEATRPRLAAATPRLDRLAAAVGWRSSAAPRSSASTTPATPQRRATASRRRGSGRGSFPGRPAGSGSACRGRKASGPTRRRRLGGDSAIASAAAQQVGVHDPAVRRARLRARRDDALARPRRAARR